MSQAEVLVENVNQKWVMTNMATKADRLGHIRDEMERLATVRDAEAAHGRADELIVQAMAIAAERSTFEDVIVDIAVQYNEVTKWYG